MPPELLVCVHVRHTRVTGERTAANAWCPPPREGTKSGPHAWWTSPPRSTCPECKNRGIGRSPGRALAHTCPKGCQPLIWGRFTQQGGTDVSRTSTENHTTSPAKEAGCGASACTALAQPSLRLWWKGAPTALTEQPCTGLGALSLQRKKKMQASQWVLSSDAELLQDAGHSTQETSPHAPRRAGCQRPGMKVPPRRLNATLLFRSDACSSNAE